MSERTAVSSASASSRPQLIYSAGFDVVALGPSERDALASHCRSLSSMRASIGWGTLGELYTVPAFGQIDYAADHVLVARIGDGPVIASAQVHRVSRLLAWGELWYSAWPGEWAHGACAQCIGRAVRWARRSGLACLVAYSRGENAAEREMLSRAGFTISFQRGELVAEMDLFD